MVAQELKITLPGPSLPRKNHCSAAVPYLIFKGWGCQYILFSSASKIQEEKKFIPKLNVGDQLAVSQEDKQAAVLEFYENLLGKAEDRDYTIKLDELGLQHQDLSALDAPFQETGLGNYKGYGFG